MPDQPKFGAELRRRREKVGISLAQLAQRVHYSKGHLSKVESGYKPPSAQLARLCDAVVDADGALVQLIAERESSDRTATQAPPDATDRDVWMLGVMPSGSGYFVPGNGSVPTQAAYGMTFGDRRTLCVDTASVTGTFRSRFSSARDLGQVAGPAVVLPVVIADAQTLRGVASNVPPDERSALWQLAARYAEFAGWMTQEAGDDRMAMWWTDAAVRMAVLGGDHALES